MGNDRGVRLADAGPPDYLALKNDRPPEMRSAAIIRSRFCAAVSIEVTGRRLPTLELDACEEGNAEEIEIEAVFRRMISGLRRMPKRDRPSALRNAREWRQFALKALREKRANARHANHMRRRLMAPAPS